MRLAWRACTVSMQHDVLMKYDAPMKYDALWTIGVTGNRR